MSFDFILNPMLLRFFCFIFFIYLSVLSNAQLNAGQWTWQSGKNFTNFVGSYGTMGVSSPSNFPAATYESSEWQDLQGNFWLYGGDRIGMPTNDLWKFDIITKEWTWISGSKGQGIMKPIYGIQGVPSVSNSPGRRQTSMSWVDAMGNFWLYGGFGCDTTSPSSGTYSDLWKYNPNLNTWVWMKGSKFDNGTPSYGVKGVEAITNLPPPMNERNITWTDSIGDLWLMDNSACLWKYRIATNNWIWIKGNYPLTSPVYAVYGIKGQSSSLNNPFPFGISYTRWKDSKGDFWYFDGLLWKYEIQNNSWTWVWGDTLNVHNHKYGTTKCDTSNHEIDPEARAETRACWVDDCDNFWMMGGHDGKNLNDLLFFSRNRQEWVHVSGDTTELLSSVYGTINIASLSNRPSSRCGALPFKDIDGNLWLFGGITSGPWIGTSYYSDLWMYTVDTTCTHCKPKNLNIGLSEQKHKNLTSKLYPNPTSGSFTFDQIEMFGEYRVTDIFGKEILNGKLDGQKTLIDIKTSGIYFLYISGKEQNFSTKIIVVNH